MSIPESHEIVDYLTKLVEASRTGSVKWIRVNPTTFAWDTKSPTPARLTLQRLQRSVVRPVDPKLPVRPPVMSLETYYVFQALDTAHGEQKISLNGTEDADINEKLDELYKTIAAGKSRADLDFLDSLLPPTVGD